MDVLMQLFVIEVDFLIRLIVIVCDCIDDIVDVRTRKLTALALIYTMNPANTSVELLKERFAEVFYVCLSCMHDLVDPITNTPDMLVVRSPKILIQGGENGLLLSIFAIFDPLYCFIEFVGKLFKAPCL